MKVSITTAASKVSRSSSFRGVLLFLGMLGIAALCVAQAAKPILTPAPVPPSQTPPTPNTDAVASMPIDPSTYLIGPEDVLQITVWKEQTLSGTFPVRPDGMISMVLLGDVKAAGLTPLQLTANLTKEYKKYIQEPLVTVGVQAVNSKHIFLVGEVGRVGPIPLTPGMTPLQAISVAGGPTPYAHLKRIYILRGPQGKQEKIPFNYKAALKGDNPRDVILEPNDTVVVP
ncbi:MAG TPA: polysaccharide biosynthesis/export family protein [Acidobacteriaceae bacterium]|nr:polysaccharide biosynthesis/export family protein [Acidobacteriaceae bacterium]